MKFLCLGYLNMREFDREPEEVKGAVLSQCGPLCENMRATGRVLVETGLADVKTAKSIRPRRGQPSVTDGPFVETKEQLGSFFIVEADDIEEAVKIASKHPAALLGEEYGFGIEVRQIMHDIL
jgi:Uncharacterized protein conserved in bacteria